MTTSTIHPASFVYGSYELPLKDNTQSHCRDVDDVSPTARTSTLSSFSLKRRRRINSCSSSTSLSSCGIHLSSLSLSSMSSMDTNHIQDYDHPDSLMPSLHCESFHSVEHNDDEYTNDDYHHYQNATDDEDAVAVGRLSKRHRAYTNLTALCSSASLSMIAKGNASGDHDHPTCGLADNPVHSDDDDDDDGWGYYVDAL
jgi:hypothetical protein